MKATRGRRPADDEPGKAQAGDYVHDVASAAIRARVSEDTIRAWIGDGMRATPVGAEAPAGEAGKRRRKCYRIKDRWLMEWMDRRADQHAEEVAAGKTGAKRPARKGRGALPGEIDMTDPIGSTIRRMGR